MSPQNRQFAGIAAVPGTAVRRLRPAAQGHAIPWHRPPTALILQAHHETALR